MLFVLTMTSNEDKVLRKRAQRNEWFLQNFSDLNDQKKQTFSGLDFYPYNSDYLKICEVELFKNNERAIFAVEGYGQIELRKYGCVKTEIDAQLVTLHLYCDIQTENPTELIAPFKDRTNGKTTYGGGRNLNVQIDNGKAIVDFNEATNMECAYSAESVCALPLPENWLSVSIEAGEKVLR